MPFIAQVIMVLWTGCNVRCASIELSDIKLERCPHC